MGGGEGDGDGGAGLDWRGNGGKGRCAYHSSNKCPSARLASSGFRERDMNVAAAKAVGWP